MVDDPKRKNEADELDAGDLYDDFGALTGIGVVLARDKDGKYLNPELVVLAYKAGPRRSLAPTVSESYPVRKKRVLSGIQIKSPLNSRRQTGMQRTTATYA